MVVHGALGRAIGLGNRMAWTSDFLEYMLEPRHAHCIVTRRRPSEKFAQTAVIGPYAG